MADRSKTARGFLLEVTQAVIEVWGANRVGVRLSPYGIANGSGEADPMPLYTHVVQSLNPLGLAYLHFIEPRSSGAGRAEVNHQNVPSAMVLFRPIWNGVLMTAGGFTGETGGSCDRRRAMPMPSRSAASSFPIPICRGVCSTDFR